MLLLCQKWWTKALFFLITPSFAVVLRQLCELQKFEVRRQCATTALQNHGQVCFAWYCLEIGIMAPFLGSTWRGRAQTSHQRTITWTSGRLSAQASSCRWSIDWPIDECANWLNENHGNPGGAFREDRTLPDGERQPGMIWFKRERQLCMVGFKL